MKQAFPDSIRPVKLSDSRELVRLNILRGTQRDVRDQIRVLKQDGFAYCLEHNADGADGVAAGGRAERELMAFAAFCRVRAGAPDIVRLSLYLPGDAAASVSVDTAPAHASGAAAAAVADGVSGAAGNPELTDRPDRLTADLRALAHHLFLHASVHRIEWLIPADQPFLLSLADALGFGREGCLRAAVRSGAVYRDAFLYSLLRWENPLTQWGFVDFGWFLAAVFGSADVVHEIRLVGYGSSPEAPGLRDGLAGLGFLDGRGTVVRHPAGSGRRAAGRRRSAAVLNPAGGVGAVFLQSGLPADGALGQGCRELSEYVLGRRTQFETPLDPAAGSPFSRRVWSLLRQIPCGQIRQYEDIAADLIARDENAAQKQISARDYARAVGAACGANPFLIMIPCHRVLGKGGKLTGFSAGIRHKAELLDYEIMGRRPPAD